MQEEKGIRIYISRDLFTYNRLYSTSVCFKSQYVQSCILHINRTFIITI
ncbi:hypothetical protein bcgnr5386_47440 [Bacillus cereus]